MTFLTDRPPPDLLDAIRQLLHLLDDEELEQSRSDTLADPRPQHCFDCETDVNADDWDEHECGLG